MIRDFFPNYQKEILAFCNTDFGKEWLQNRLEGRVEGKITQITPNSIHCLRDFKESKPVIQGRFYCGNQFERLFQPLFDKVSIANDYKGIEDKQDALSYYAGAREYAYKYPQIFLSNTNYSLYAGDGNASYYDGGGNWASSHDAGTGTGVDYTGDSFSVFCWTPGSGYWQILRGFLPIDTSSLSSLATITAANLHLYANQYTATAYDMSIIQTTQTSTSEIVVADYSKVGTTKGATDKSSGDWTGTPSIQSWALNATGLTFIVKAGATKLGVRTAKDVGNSAPASAGGLQNIASSEAVSNNPYLDITYTLPSSGGMMNFFMN